LAVQEFLYGIGGGENVELVVWDADNHSQLALLKASYIIDVKTRSKISL